MSLFKKNFTTLVEGAPVDDAESDFKEAKTIGKYRFGKKAVYRPDYSYVPYSEITAVVKDKGSVHVTGCCAGGVPIDRLVITAGGKPFVFEMDSPKAQEKAAGIIEESLNA